MNFANTYLLWQWTRKPSSTLLFKGCFFFLVAQLADLNSEDLGSNPGWCLFSTLLSIVNVLVSWLLLLCMGTHSLSANSSIKKWHHKQNSQMQIAVKGLIRAVDQVPFYIKLFFMLTLFFKEVYSNSHIMLWRSAHRLAPTGFYTREGLLWYIHPQWLVGRPCKPHHQFAKLPQLCNKIAFFFILPWIKFLTCKNFVKNR